MKAATGGRGVRIALECAGSSAGRDLSILVTAKQGTVMLYGTAYGDVTFAEKAFARMVRDELQVVGSWNSYSLPFPGKEWFDIIELVAHGPARRRAADHASRDAGGGAGDLQGAEGAELRPLPQDHVQAERLTASLGGGRNAARHT